MSQYKPTAGYFDLTEKPKGMTRKTHKKVQDMQTMLIAEAEKYKDPAVRQNNWTTYEKLTEYMAQLQAIILNYWPHEL